MRYVRVQKVGLDTCVNCQDLAGQNPVTCSGSPATSCQTLVQYSANQIAAFQAALVQSAAPSSLSAKDFRLQQDLAQADTVLIAMSTAVSVGDQAGFNAGRVSFQRALAAINRDAADILNS